MIRDKAKMCGKCGIVADPFWRPLPEVSTRYNLRPMFGLAKTVNASDLEVSLLDVVRLRTSQINSCAHCADMESKDLRARGEKRAETLSPALLLRN